MSKPRWLESLEQTGHFCLGFVARLFFLDYLWWRREAVKQWPPGKPWSVAGMAGNPIKGWSDVTQLDRVADMMTDIRWYVIGGTCADVARAAALIWWLT